MRVGPDKAADALAAGVAFCARCVATHLAAGECETPEPATVRNGFLETPDQEGDECS